jgi:hypothetical protein
VRRIEPGVALGCAILLSGACARAAAPATPEPPPDLAPAARIQRRFIEKKLRVALYAGFAWIGRNDFYRSPGIELAASFYVIEPLAIDVRGAYLFSSPTQELNELVARTGYMPDTRAETATVLGGLRWSIGYAKIRLSEKHTLHFEPQLFLYGGLHVAAGPFRGTTVGPMGELGLGFLLFLTRRIQARIDAGITVEGEQRTSYVAVIGGYPVVSVGAMF